jgi:deuterolysin
MSFSIAFLLSVLAVPALGSPIVPFNRRSTGLSVELSAVDDTQVKAVLTNTGAESVSLLNFGTFMDSKPVQKVDVYKNGSFKLSYLYPLA